MFNDKCRLCLSKKNLTPLFKTTEQININTSVLFQTTGLKIEAHDGLPQTICDTCTKAVDSAFKLRNRCHLSEKLLKYEHKQRNQVNIVRNESPNTSIFNSEDKNSDFYKDCDDNRNRSHLNERLITYEQEHKIEVNIVRNESLNSSLLNSNDKNSDFNEDYDGNKKILVLGKQNDKAKVNGAKPNCPSDKQLKRLEKRRMYLNLAEGTYDPKAPIMGPIKCKICKLSLRHWPCFVNHTKSHLGFEYMCEFCGKIFRKPLDLKIHCMTHHGMENASELKCNHCDYLALDNVQLKIHVRRMHTGERPYICDTCGSSFHSRRCLIQHIESHRTEAKVKCNSCSKMFKSTRALSRHRYTTHTQKRVDCPHCSREFSRKYLKVHIEKCHTDA